MTTILLSAALGGVVLFLWGFITHMILPFHNAAFRRFKDEDAVGGAVRDNAEASGIYVYPFGLAPPGSTKEEKKAVMDAAIEKAKGGPLVFASVRAEGPRPFGQALFLTFVADVLVAGVLAALLTLVRENMSMFDMILFAEVAAVLVALAADIPQCIWWGFSGEYTAANILLDRMVGFGAVAVVVALVA